MRDWLRKRAGLVIIVLAAALLELLSGAQYLSTHQLLEETLEKRAESELTLKAILIKSTLNSAEDILKNHIWDIRQNLEQPDSVMEALGRMIVPQSHRSRRRAGICATTTTPRRGGCLNHTPIKVATASSSGRLPAPTMTISQTIPIRQLWLPTMWIEPYLDRGRRPDIGHLLSHAFP